MLGQYLADSLAVADEQPRQVADRLTQFVGNGRQFFGHGLNGARFDGLCQFLEPVVEVIEPLGQSLLDAQRHVGRCRAGVRPPFDLLDEGVRGCFDAGQPVTDVLEGLADQSLLADLFVDRTGEQLVDARGDFHAN